MKFQCNPFLDWALPLPDTEYLAMSDERLRDYADAGLDVETLLTWVNCPDPVFRLGRIRFLDTYSVLLPATVTRQLDAGFLRIAAAVDRGDPVFDILASTFQVRKSTLRILQKLKLSAIGGFWVTNEEERTLLMALDALPEIKHPKTFREWEIMYEYATALRMTPGHTTERIFQRLCMNGYECSYKKVVSASFGQPYKLEEMNLYLDLMESWIDEVAIAASGNGTSNGDSAYIFTGCHAMPRLSSHGDRTRRLCNQFLSEWNAYDLVRQVARLRDGMWRVYFRSMNPEQAKLYAYWHPLFPDPYRPEGGILQIHSVASWAELTNEAKAMSNCLVDYHVPCLLQDTYVVSVREIETGQSLATAEIALDIGEDGQHLCVLVQCRGIRNAEPSGECMNVVIEAIESINRNQEWLQKLSDEACVNHEFLSYDGMYEDIFFRPCAKQVMQEVFGVNYQREENRLAYIMLCYFPEMLASPKVSRNQITSDGGKQIHKVSYAYAHSQTAHTANRR